VRDARVDAHQHGRVGDEGRERVERQRALAREDQGRADACEPRHLARALPLGRPRGDDHLESARGEPARDGGEALCGPATGAVEGADVHDSGAGNLGRGIRNPDRHVVGARREPMPAHEPRPALALEQAVDPFGAGPRHPVGARARVTQPPGRRQRLEQRRALRAPPVQVDRDVDRAVPLERRVEPGRRQQLDRRVDEAHHRLEPAGRREHEAVRRVAAPQRLQRGHRDEQVAELESAQGEQDGSVIGHGLPVPG